MIGGTDIELTIASDIPAAEVIFRTVRRNWPNFVFQDADEDTAPYTTPTDGGLPELSGPEFFVYRDKQAALSWDHYGAGPENFNTMLHVILGEEEPPCSGMRPLTLVCDDVVGEMRALIADIEREFEHVSTGR